LHTLNELQIKVDELEIKVVLNKKGLFPTGKAILLHFIRITKSIYHIIKNIIKITSATLLTKYQLPGAHRIYGLWLLLTGLGRASLKSPNATFTPTTLDSVCVVFCFVRN
jgi:hypothetical protein